MSEETTTQKITNVLKNVLTKLKKKSTSFHYKYFILNNLELLQI